MDVTEPTACGCYGWRDGDGITFCSLHAAAPGLLEALAYAAETLDSEDRLRWILGTEWMDEAKTAIAKARGE